MNQPFLLKLFAGKGKQTNKQIQKTNLQRSCSCIDGVSKNGKWKYNQCFNVDAGRERIGANPDSGANHDSDPGSEKQSNICLKLLEYKNYMQTLINQESVVLPDSAKFLPANFLLQFE